MNLVLKIFVRPEIFVYVAFIVFTAIFFVLTIHVDGTGGEDVLRHYVQLNMPRLLWTVGLFLVALLTHAIVLWVRAFIKQIEPDTVFSKENAGRIRTYFRTLLKDVIVIGVPFILAFYSLSIAIGKLNVFNATRLQDEILLRWDTLLTGTFPPLSLASFTYPAWFVSAVDFSFFYLVPVLTIFGGYLFIAHQHLFREAAGAFFLSAMIMFAGWTLFPVLSPNDRFVDNVYNLPIPVEVQQYVDAWRPQEEILAFWEKIYASREGLTVFPTTAIPSAHVVWAVFLVYYSWRAWRWLPLISFPFALLATFGTNLFAAHYFVDMLAGLMCGVLAIVIAKWMVKKNKNAPSQGSRFAIN